MPYKPASDGVIAPFATGCVHQGGAPFGAMFHAGKNRVIDGVKMKVTLMLSRCQCHSRLLKVNSMVDKTKITPRQFPLHYVYDELRGSDGSTFKNDDGTPIKNVRRLGIWTSVNDGAPQCTLFDTGSDQFNTQIGAKVSGVKKTGDGPRDTYLYLYGDGTYGYLVQKVTVNHIKCYSPQDIDEAGQPKKNAKPSDFSPLTAGHFIIGKIEAYLFSEDYRQSEELNIDNLKKRGVVSDAHVINSSEHEDMYGSKPDKKNNKKYYIDLHAQRLMAEGKPGDERLDLRNEEGAFSGCFGAGDYLTPKTDTGILGSATTSGYIIAANGNTDFYAQTRVPLGCSPCVIMHLNESLRAQFTSFMPWSAVHNTANDQETFPGSGAHGSTEYEGAYTLWLCDEKGQKTGHIDGVTALFDTGYGMNGALVLGEKTFDGLKSKGYLQADKGLSTYHQDKAIILAPGGEEVALMNLSVQRAADIKDEQGKLTPAANQISVGLDFFLSQSVLFDLKNETTAYTRYFISTYPFSTGKTAGGHLDITWEMGSSHPVQDAQGKPRQAPVKGGNGRVALENVMGGYLGVAAAITGKGRLFIRNYAVARLTAANTYDGETHIEKDGTLELAGPGRIENSVRLIVNGTLDISQSGNAKKAWGMESAVAEVVIRDLGGSGRIVLGKRTLVLTAAKGHFDGVIMDTGGKGRLRVGMKSRLSLGGQHSFTGDTEVSHGATLHITETGLLSGPVTVRGTLVVDGHVSGTITLEKGAVLSGSGTTGKVINRGGKNLMTAAPK